MSSPHIFITIILCFERRYPKQNSVIRLKSNIFAQWRTRWGGGRPPGLKNLGQTPFSGQAQVAQKSWKIKNISIQWKISGQILFFRASAGRSKFWMIKNIYSIIGVRSGGLGGPVAPLSWKISGQTLFSGQA